MKLRFTLILFLLVAAIGTARADIVDLGIEPAGLTEEKAPADTMPLKGNWFQQLWKTGFHINDPRIRYPKFPDFCRRVYNWGNDVFNTYDTDYVVATGKNWKVILDATGSMQSYGYLFDVSTGEKGLDRVLMRSNIGYDVGVRLNFMAVSVGYTWNMNELTGHNAAPRSTFNFSFTCARFSAELLSQRVEGNTFIERFGRYKDGKPVHIPLDNTRRRTFMINAFYFLNHRKYSQAAAYCFSKYQKKSAGSWLVGARYAQQHLQLDFTDLDADILAFKPADLPLLNRFNFHDMTLQGGYAYNAVMPHNWLFNITLLPGIGYRRSLLKSEMKKTPLQEMVATGVDGRISLVYNHRALFLNVTAKANASFLFNAGYSFFMSSEQASFVIGARF